MAQIVKLRRSSVTGNKPTTAQLELGELAINTFDGKLYLEQDQTSQVVLLQLLQSIHGELE